MPLFMIGASVGLISLYLIDRDFSADVFQTLWAINVFTYLFITISSFSRGSRRPAVLFRGPAVPRGDLAADHHLRVYPPLLSVLDINPAAPS